MTKELIERIRIGDPIDDKELDDAIKFYKELESKTKLLGQRFHFYWVHCLNELRRLQGYKEARKRK